jgi:hypothetical protein
MAVVWYVAVRKFGPHLDECWQGYVDWTGHRFLQEVITLDGILCPPVIEHLTEQDWQHNVHEDYVTDFFRDLDYVLSRVSSIRDETIQVLAVILIESFAQARTAATPRGALPQRAPC